MAGNVVLAAGLLMFIFVQYGVGSSEVVPDGVVFTEVKKTLIQGVPGILSCRFYGQPYAVYWGMGHDPDDLTPFLVWHEGTKSGPRYSDGSLDIDENYTLIIKNVSMADAGRFYCTVSNYLGILIDNYTDVFVVDTAIVTKSQVTLQMRPYLRGVVQCTVHIRPRTVSWTKKSTSSSSDEALAIFEDSGTVVKRSGAGYDEGMYSISDDYSLVINNVNVYNEGTYTCNVTDFDTGMAFQDDTRVSVVAPPREPFPTILECLHDDSDLSYCSVPAETALTITCLVREYYPNINLTFLYGSGKVKILKTREQNNTDGTKNKTITIAAIGSKELYTCVASNIPGTRLNRSTSALLHDHDDTEHFIRGVLVAVLIPFVALTLISSMIYIIWRKRYRNHGDGDGYSLVTQVKLQEIIPLGVKELAPEDFKLIEQHVNDVSMRHYKEICGLLKKKSTFQTEKIIDENKTALFNTDQMLADWSQRGTSTQISQARQPISKTEEAKDSAWPSDEDLEWISRHLTKESMTAVCKELNIDCKSRYFDEEWKILGGLRDWRNKKANKSIENKHMKLLLALDSSNLRGLLPTLKGRLVYKVEVVDMAFQLLMHDLLPSAKALGISVTKLISYRPAFQPFYLMIGTIDLLSKLLKSIIDAELLPILEKGDRRPIFCNIIGQIQYWSVAIKGMLMYDMSYGELDSISGEMKKISEERSARQAEGEERASGERYCSSAEPSTLQINEEDETEIGHTEIQSCRKRSGIPRIGSLVEVPKDLVDLQDVLQITDEDIAQGLQFSHPITDYALFKIWKEMPRSSVFNYRAVLAHHLRGIEMSSLADEVITGKYIKEQTSLEFIRNMVQGLTRDQLRSLGKLLRLSGKDENWHTSTSFDVICQHIYEWVKDWTKQMKKPGNVVAGAMESLKKVSSIDTTCKKHRAFNDLLVDQGFLDLAREIMIIEQQMLN